MKEKISIERGYVVSQDGVLCNLLGRNVKVFNIGGYLYFSIRIGEKYESVAVHRLQAYQKFGDLLYQEGIVTRHLNGIKLDNSWENISIGTASDNYHDIPKSIIFRILNSARVKTKKYNNRDIINYYSESKSYKKTMERFNIPSKGTLWFILNKSIKD